MKLQYKSEIIKSMTWLGQKPDTIFLGQAIGYPGHAMSGTVEGVPTKKLYELPVIEELQMGISTGLALSGFVPITCYPRFDFLILAMNQLVNHLDKMQTMSKGEKRPKVIIRTSIGSKTPLDAGPQHTQNHTEAFKRMLTEVEVVLLEEPEQIFPAFEKAYSKKGSTLLIEYGEYYSTK